MANTLQERLEQAKNTLEQLDKERDKVTLHQRTQNITDLMTEMGAFVDDHLYDAITVLGEAIDRINELEDRVEELESEKEDEQN